MAGLPPYSMYPSWCKSCQPGETKCSSKLNGVQKKTWSVSNSSCPGNFQYETHMSFFCKEGHICLVLIVSDVIQTCHIIRHMIDLYIYIIEPSIHVIFMLNVAPVLIISNDNFSIHFLRLEFRFVLFYLFPLEFLGKRWEGVIQEVPF